MKKCNNILLVVVLVMAASCQKVVDLKLKDGGKQLVVEGNITDEPGPYTVTVSQTTRYNETWQFEGVAGASVVVRDNAGNSETLQETTPGVYVTTGLSGVAGRTYELRVVVGAASYAATSTMPMRVPFDSIYIRNVDNFGKLVKAAVPVFVDPKGQGNNYRFNQYVNGRLDKELYYQNDDFTDGLPNSFSLMDEDPDSTLHVGDQVIIDMQCIDKAMYKYWFSLDQSSSGDGSNIPSNPVTNITGGVLGYFSAHTSQRRSITVK